MKVIDWIDRRPPTSWESPTGQQVQRWLLVRSGHTMDAVWSSCYRAYLMLWLLRHGAQDVDERALRLYSCDCAWRILERYRASGMYIDPRLWSAVSVATKFANGKANLIMLGAAQRDANEVKLAGTITRMAAWVAGQHTNFAAAEVTELAVTATCILGDDQHDWYTENQWQARKLREYLMPVNVS